MKQKKNLLLVILLVVMLAASGCSTGKAAATVAPTAVPTAEPTAEPVVEATEAPKDPVIFSFDGEEVRFSYVEELAYNLYQNGYVTEANDYLAAIEYIVEEKCILGEIEKQGLNQFSAEEEEAFRADAQAEWDLAIADYVSYFLTEDTDEAREKARQDGEAYYHGYGFSVEVLAQNYRNAAAFEKLQNKLLEGKDVIPTEEEIVAMFETYAAQDQQMYENNFFMYEMYQQYGQESWYKPEGFRGITHILLEVDEELLNAYMSAQAAYEETLSMEEAPAAEANEDGTTPDPTEKPVTKEDVDAALKAVLDSRKEAIDDIYARLEKGESFESLINEYGTDPGMKDPETLKTGYEVHAESTMTYIPEFVAGAFSEKMQKPGDYSDPVVASYGIHILYYLCDIPGGFVEISDTIRADITNYLTNKKTNEIYTAAFDEWKLQHEIVYQQEAMEECGIVSK